MATGGGVYRLDSLAPSSLGVAQRHPRPRGRWMLTQFDCFALNPTDANQALGNISFVGDVAGNDGPAMHDAIQFLDAAGEGDLAYGWKTVDANGVDNNTGEGQVIYNTFNPSIVYRVVPDGGGNYIRQSTDGGQTWTAVTTGFQADPFPGLGAIPFLAIDPSQPNRLFSGFDQVQVTDNNATSWSTSMQTGSFGGSVKIPNLPTTGITKQMAAPCPLPPSASGAKTASISAAPALTA